jgi:hypothetical protein
MLVMYYNCVAIHDRVSCVGFNVTLFILSLFSSSPFLCFAAAVCFNDRWLGSL